MPTFTNAKDLMKAVRAGNEEAYEYLFKTYYPRLRNFAARFIDDSDMVADILQECYLRLWERRETLAVTSLQAFLFTMVRNACLNELKHRAVVWGYESHVQGGNTGSEELYALDFTGRTDELLLFDELRKQVDAILDTLPERTREVFVMSRFEGKKNREIAEALGISTKVVEKHITKALRAFTRQLGHRSLPMLFFLF